MAIKRIVTDDTIQLVEGADYIASIAASLEDGEVLLKLAGSFRSDTEHELLDEMMALTTLGLHLTLDLSDVTYISAACLQVLLTIQQKMDDQEQGTLLLTNLSNTVAEALEKTGLSELLMIDE